MMHQFYSKWNYIIGGVLLLRINNSMVSMGGNYDSVY